MHSRSKTCAAAAVAIALATVGACDTRNESQQQQREPQPPSHVIANAPAPAKRPPLSGYAKARRVAIGPLARPIDPTAVYTAVRDWSRVPEPIRQLGRDARSGEVASLLVAGAAEPQRDTAGAGPDEWRQVAALVIAVTYEDAMRGQLGDVAARLGAVAQLGHDLGDAATVRATVGACETIAAAHAEEAELARACEQLASEADSPK